MKRGEKKKKGKKKMASHERIKGFEFGNYQKKHLKAF